MKRSAIISRVLILAGLAVALGACDNPILALAELVQATAASPVISVSLADGTALSAGGSYDLGTIPYGNIADLTIVIANTGAVRYYQQAAKLTPDNAVLFMNMARAQRALGHAAEADTALARAQQLDPQLVERSGPAVPVAGSSTRAAEASAPDVLWLEQ